MQAGRMLKTRFAQFAPHCCTLLAELKIRSRAAHTCRWRWSPTEIEFKPPHKASKTLPSHELHTPPTEYKLCWLRCGWVVLVLVFARRATLRFQRVWCEWICLLPHCARDTQNAPSAKSIGDFHWSQVSQAEILITAEHWADVTLYVRYTSYHF